MAKPIRLLSIDGGGIRGVIAASVLVEVERMIQEREGPETRLADCFDLFAGTSTGGLITGLLLLPEHRGTTPTNPDDRRPALSADDILNFYLTQASTLFHRSFFQRIKRVGALFDERYGSDGFNRLLDVMLGPRGGPGPEPMLSDLLKPTVIPTYNASTGKPYFFKQHEAATADGHDFSVRDVALATASAPTYFETAKVSSGGAEFGACVDGGIFANNPTMCGFAEAHSYFGYGAKDMAILSIGTGSYQRTFTHDKMANWGVLTWMEPLIDMMLSSSEHIVDHQVDQLFGTLAEESAELQYLRMQADLRSESAATAMTDNAKPANLRRLVEIGKEVVEEHRDNLEQFIETQILGPHDPPRPTRRATHDRTTTVRSLTDTDDAETETHRTGGPAPTAADRLKIKALVWMRTKHFATVDQSSVAAFRRRRVPVSGMPQLVRACGKYSTVTWAPKELVVPDVIPTEAHLPKGYMASYYGLGKLGWGVYNRAPVQPEVMWDPDFEWNQAFPPTGDGWENPTTDETFARLRLQGPNPWLLRRIDDRTDANGTAEPMFEVDYTSLFDGILPPIVARFAVRGGEFVPTEISVDSGLHHPGDPTWDQAKRVANGADVRFAVFGRHLLDTHLIVGAAFALAAYSLPTWHRLRPFMAFFTYGTLAVNDLAYRALVSPGSYFIESGFATVDDVRRLFTNMISQFDLDQWIAPRDIANRGIDAIPDHPYVQDATLVWPAFVEVVERHLGDLGLDDAAIAGDKDLQTWYLTLAKILPNTDPRERPLDRFRLAELCTALLWNNIVHEICGDFSPIAGSEDPADKAMLNMTKLRSAVSDGDLSSPVEPPTMADVFLIDQASYVSRFNVGGNNILRINAARLVDDPKLRLAIEDLQATLRELETDLLASNETRSVRFARMLPRHWEASVSF